MGDNFEPRPPSDPVQSVNPSVTPSPEEFARLQTELAREKEQSENYRQKAKLLAQMSHDIRTPLNVIVGLTTILQRDGYTPQKRQEFLQTLMASAEHLTDVIRDLLDTATSQAQDAESLRFKQAQPSAPEKAQPLEQEHKKSFKVLVVEDFAPNTLVATSYLKLFGYNFDVARNGREALKILEESSYDTILMDVQMPEMDGFEATAAIRQMEAETLRRHIPIVGMTAHAAEGDRERCLEHGMDNYISKPFKAAELKNLLSQYMA